MINVEPTVDEATFEEILKLLLGDSYERALTLFHNCQNLSFDIANVLRLAVRTESAEEALAELEQHYREYLFYQDPEIRGLITNNMMRVSPTAALLLRLAEKYHSGASL